MRPRLHPHLSPFALLALLLAIAGSVGAQEITLDYRNGNRVPLDGISVQRLGMDLRMESTFSSHRRIVCEVVAFTDAGRVIREYRSAAFDLQEGLPEGACAPRGVSFLPGDMLTPDDRLVSLPDQWFLTEEEITLRRGSPAVDYARVARAIEAGAEDFEGLFAQAVPGPDMPPPFPELRDYRWVALMYAALPTADGDEGLLEEFRSRPVVILVDARR